MTKLKQLNHQVSSLKEKHRTLNQMFFFNSKCHSHLRSKDRFSFQVGSNTYHQAAFLSKATPTQENLEDTLTPEIAPSLTLATEVDREKKTTKRAREINKRLASIKSKIGTAASAFHLKPRLWGMQRSSKRSQTLKRACFFRDSCIREKHHREKGPKLQRKRISVE